MANSLAELEKEENLRGKFKFGLATSVGAVSGFALSALFAFLAVTTPTLPMIGSMAVLTVFAAGMNAFFIEESIKTGPHENETKFENEKAIMTSILTMLGASVAGAVTGAVLALN